MAYNRKDFLKVLGIGMSSSVVGFNSISNPILHPLLKSRPLKKGDTVGMISPASSLSEENQYEEVTKKIEELGFQVKVGPHAKKHFGYFAGTDKNRAADLNAMFFDDMIDAILPFRGGWGSNRILEYVNFELISDNPKPLIGFSDITSLLLAIYAKTGLVTYHGPVGKSEWSAFTRSYFEKALMQSQPFTMRNKDLEGENYITTITGGRATGTLLGGNLSVLTSMMGSDYLPHWQNSLLFLEDVGEDIYRIDRMLTQLRLNGVFNKINGLIFGKCTNCEVSEGYHFTLEQILQDHIQEFNIPAFVGANIGHIEDMFTLPVGVKATMDARKGSIQLLEPPTKPEN